MEIKAFELLDIYESLNKLSEQELDLETSYTIAKYIKEILVAKDLIDGKRNKIIIKYAKKQEDGNLKQAAGGNIEISKDSIEKFNSDMEKLLNSKIDIPKISLKKDSLSKITIQPKYLLPLIGIILEE